MTEHIDRFFDADDAPSNDARDELAGAASPCSELADDLYAYHRQELSGVELAAVDAHLRNAGCGRCTEALRDMEAFAQLLDSGPLQPREPSPQLLSRILATIAEEELSTGRRTTGDAERELPASREVDRPRRT